MKPVGLTRAEEALQERREERVRVVAPQGAVRCQVNVGDGCVAAAVYRVVWKDGQETPACEDCALQARQQLPGAIIRVELIASVDKR
jgi:hypothetical protein